MLTSRWLYSRSDRLAIDGDLCAFGVTEVLTAALVSAGVGAGTAAIAAPALLGAAGGALTSGITGGDPLTGALTGGLTGGAIGFGPDIGGFTGLGTVGGDVLAGAGAGALGAGITGSNPLTGALTGGAAGLASGLTAGATGGTSPSGETSNLSAGAAQPGAVAASPESISLSATPATGVSGASGAAAPAPAGVSAAIGAQPFDLTSLGATGAGDAGTLASSVGIGGPVGSSGGIPGGAPVAPSADVSALAGGGGSGALDPVASANLAGENLLGPNVSGGISGSVPTAGATAAPAAAAKPGFISSGLQDLGVGSGTADLIGKGVGPAIAAGGLGYSLLSQPASGVSSTQAAGDAASLQKNADTLAAAGTANQGYLNSGTLPAGAQAAVNSASNAAKAKLRSDYARLGLTGSTMEGQALANIDQQASAQVFSIGNQLVNTGLTQTQLADSLYQQLIGLNTQQNASTQTAIAGLAQALSGTSGTTIKLAA